MPAETQLCLLNGDPTLGIVNPIPIHCLFLIDVVLHSSRVYFHNSWIELLITRFVIYIMTEAKTNQKIFGPKVVMSFSDAEQCV